MKLGEKGSDGARESRSDGKVALRAAAFQHSITPTLRLPQSRCGHRVSFAASRGRNKGTVQGELLVRHLPGFAPCGAMLDDPVRQGPLEADVMPGFFRFDPLVFEDLFALSL